MSSRPRAIPWQLTLPLRTEELELLPTSSSSFTVSALTAIEPASDDQLEYIQMCHIAIVGHNGVDRTLTRLFSLQQVWKHMKQHVRTFIQNCPCCQKLSAKDPKINASHFATSNYAIFDTLNVDYIDPFPDKGYILVIIDIYTMDRIVLVCRRRC